MVKYITMLSIWFVASAQAAWVMPQVESVTGELKPASLEMRVASAASYEAVTQIVDSATSGMITNEVDGVAHPIATNALAIAQAARTAATNAQASASVSYAVGTNAVAIATTANTSATNALDILSGLSTNGSVWASTILGNPTNCWLDIVEELPYIHRQAATADIRVEAVFDDMNNNQTYSGPPVGTVWQNIGVGAWASTNGWALTNTINNVWLIQNGYMSPVIFGNQNVSEFPASLSGTYPFSMGSLVLDWVYVTEASRLLEAPDIAPFATTNYVEAVRGVWADVATNLTYHIVVSNGNWLIIEN